MNTNQITLPTIVNIREAEILCHDFPAVITAGPSKYEVKWKHQNHFVRTFDDTIYKSSMDAPRIEDVKSMLDFAAQNDGDILIHCHAGMSRSTATAWGVAIQRGADPFEAYEALKAAHPAGRMFWPNDLMVEHLETIFNISGLVEYNDHNHFYDPKQF